MRNDVSFTLRIGGIVIATAALGLGVFLYVGSTAGVYALTVGIPAVIVGAAVVYARRERPAGSQRTTRYFEEKAEAVGGRMRSLLDRYDRLDQRLEEWDGDEVDDELTHALDRFAEAGVEFDRATNRFDVTGSGQVRDLERLDDRIDELREELASSAARGVERKRDACVRAQRELRDAGLVDDVREPPAADADAADDVLGEIETYDDRLRDAVDEAVDELRAIASENDHPGDAVERGDGAARSALDRGDYAAVAAALIDAREELERDLSSDFESERETLEALIDTVTSSVVDDYVRPGLVDDVRGVQRELDDVDTALELAEIERLARRARDRCTEMVEDMGDDLTAAMDALSSADVPDGYYEYQSASDEAYASRLRSTDDLDEYRREWLTAVGELSEALDAVEEKAAVAEAFGPVSDDIEDRLRESGRVEPDDLRVKQPAEFMELYAAEADDVAYEPTTPALVADDFGETHEVTVRAGFAEGGPERPVSVALDGSAFSASETFETHLLDVVHFEDVPYGEYELTVSTSEVGYETIERTVSLSADEEFEALLNEVTLRESVCDGIEQDARDALDDAVGLFGDRYEEAEYLSETMDLPMDDEYVPCLLALYAEREGLTARRVDGEVLVYDSEQFANRLSNIMRHNLGSGESMSYEEIRNRYLSVPASKDLITETLEGSAVGPEVDCGPQEISKR